MLSAPGKEAATQALAGIARANESERYRTLERYEALWEGLRYEYECRPSWWDPTVPLRERAPCVVYPIARSAGKRLTSLVFGDGRFPAITSDTSLSVFLQALIKQAKLRLVMRALLMQSFACGSACVLVALRAGFPVLEVMPAKWCTPTLDERGCVTSLVIQYKVRSGDDLCWYRRTITKTEDTEFELAPVREDAEPVFVPKQTTALPGICPVVWMRNAPDPSGDSIDGTPLAMGLEDEMEALDFSVSQRHRNAQYNGEPMMVRILGDEDESEPAGPPGRAADPRVFSWANSVVQGMRNAFIPGNTGAVTRKGPGQITTLSKGGDMKLVESSGAGAIILDGDSAALRRMILEVLGVVMADPETISANASAALQKQLYAPMLATCDDLRETWGDAIVQILNKLLALCGAVDPRVASVFVDGFAQAQPALRAQWSPAGWKEIPLALQWGEYFDPTPADLQAAAAAATAANGGRPVLSHRSSVRYVAKLAGIEDVDAELAEIARDEAGGLDAVSKVLGANPNAG